MLLVSICGSLWKNNSLNISSVLVSAKALLATAMKSSSDGGESVKISTTSNDNPAATRAVIISIMSTNPAYLFSVSLRTGHDNNLFFPSKAKVFHTLSWPFAVTKTLVGSIKFLIEVCCKCVIRDIVCYVAKIVTIVIYTNPHNCQRNFTQVCSTSG